MTAAPQPTDAFFRDALQAALAKVEAKLERFYDRYPDDTTRRGRYPLRPHPGLPDGANVGWTTAFWTGQLWLAYEASGDARFREAAEGQVTDFAARLDQGLDLDHHDLGFLYSLSCVAAQRLTGSELAGRTAVRAAERLMTRYLARAGVIQAWGDLHDPRQRGRIIIDCLMNLPLLHHAAGQTGDGRFRDAALHHALRSRDHLVRPDDTTFHTFFFDPDSGRPLYGQTAQGAHDASCWARGQAWGMYGFALNHAYAPGEGFLDVARRLAGRFLALLPPDGVPYWDLSFGAGSGEERDSSASAIAACGLLEIAAQLPEGEERAFYQAQAKRLLAALIQTCSTRNQPDSDALLLHGVYDKPRGVGIDEGNLWGDYFYLEGLMRLNRDWQRYW